MAEQYKLEIEYLKEELAASQKKVDRYAHLIASLSDELDSLRSSICLTCKRNFVPSTKGASPSNSNPTQPSPPTTNFSNSPVSVIPVPSNPTPSPPSTIDPNPVPGIGTPPNPPEPTWTVEHNPKLKQSLDLQVAHVLTYDTSVYCMKLSPDGKKIAVGLEVNGKTYIHDIKSGSVLCVLEDHYHIQDRLSIWSIQFSPDSRLLATASSDNKIRIWDITQKRVRQQFKSHTDYVNRLAFSPNGRSLVSASFDHSVRLWSLRDGSSKKASYGTYFGSAAFHPDGRYFAAGNYDHAVRIWDARTMKLVTSWTGHAGHVWCLEFTPNGKGLLCGSTDGILKYWDVSSLGEKDPKEIRKFTQHTNYLQSVAFFRENSQWVLTSINDRFVRLWDMELDDWLLTLRDTDLVREVGASRTENYLATASRGRRVTIWKYRNLSTGVSKT